MITRTALFASLIMSLSVEAHALCRDDLKDLKPHIDQIKTSDPQRYWLAEKWYGRALEAEPGSEVECLNFVARSQKALQEPLPTLADCTGTNANLAQCQNGGGVGAAYGGPIQPFGVGGIAGAGGGVGGAPAAATPVQPAAPVTSGTSTPFTPPGSVGAPSVSSGN
jgi:hypothetical protein